MSRVFLMKWYHFSVEYFEDLRNVNHCEFLIMRKKEDSGKYILENKLRTWSELKHEKLAITAPKDKEREREKGKDTTAREPVASPIPPRKKWGGCPNGCDHGRHYYRKENSMHAMQTNGRQPNSRIAASPAIPADVPADSSPHTLASRRPATRRWLTSSEDEDDPRGRIGPPALDVQASLDEMVSSPDGTPSFISVEDRLRNRLLTPNRLVRGGRDFGGSASGNTSVAGSDTEMSAAEEMARNVAARRARTEKKPAEFGESGMGRGAKADALGDQSDVGSDGDPAGVEAEVEAEVRAESSVEASVY